MSILIRGMEMPKNCDSCPCYYETEGAWRNECEVLQREHYITNERPDWCPLVPVPPHGRLIDIEPFMRGLYEEIQVGEITYTSQEIYDMMDNEIKSMPTIIEAEEAKDD